MVFLTENISVRTTRETYDGDRHKLLATDGAARVDANDEVITLLTHNHNANNTNNAINEQRANHARQLV